MSVKENIEDVAKLQLCAGAPQIQKHLRKWLLPKREKEPYYPKLRALLATPHLLDEIQEEPEPETDDEDEDTKDALVENVESHDFLNLDDALDLLWPSSDEEFEDEMEQD